MQIHRLRSYSLPLISYFVGNGRRGNDSRLLGFLAPLMKADETAEAVASSGGLLLSC